MKKTKYYDFRFFSAYKYFCAIGYILLGFIYPFQVNAAKLPDFQKIGINQTGNSAKFGSELNAFPGAGNINPVSGSGWTKAGNFGVPPPASGPSMNMSATGDVFFSGTKYPFQAGYSVPKSTIIDSGIAVASAINGPLGIGLAITMPFLYDWATKNGVRENPDGSGLQRSDPEVCTVSPCYEYNLSDTEFNSGWQRSPQLAVSVWCAGKNAYFDSVQSRWKLTCELVNNSTARYTFYYRSDGRFDSTGTMVIGVRGALPSAASWIVSSLSDIAPYLKSSSIAPDGRLIQEILENGGDIPMPAPTITGPASIDGPTKTTDHPDGTKTVEKTTHNFQTSGDTVTNVSNVTVTQTYNTSNVVTSTTTTTVNPAPADKTPDECEKNPESLACSELDTPEGEIPKTEKNITYQAENLGLGGGACPADKIINISGIGSVTAFDWAESCGYITSYVKPMILALAGFAALMIIFVGVKIE